MVGPKGEINQGKASERRWRGKKRALKEKEEISQKSPEKKTVIKN